GLLLADQVEQARAVAGLADDLEPGPLEQAREALAQKDVVVRDDDSSRAVRGRLDAVHLTPLPPAPPTRPRQRVRRGTRHPGTKRPTGRLFRAHSIRDPGAVQ